MSHRKKEQIWKDFGSWVKSTREAIGISQAGAARRAEIDRQQWYRIEAGKSGTKRETAIRIAQALSADTDEALRLAGYAPETLPLGPPQNRKELIEALERIGVEQIQFHEDISDKSPAELLELFDAIKLAVEITLSRQNR